MRATSILLCAMLLTTTLLALAPTVEARGFCVKGVDAGCPGVYCTWDAMSRRWDCLGDDPIIVCVRDCDPTEG